MVEFEHTLFQLLLLIGLLNSKPPHQKYTPYILAVGILLVFLPSGFSLSIPWDLFLGLTLPLLLWQNARRLINAVWRGKWMSLFLWVGAALLFGLMLTLTDALVFPGAILVGLITASMIWRTGESEESSSFISQIGPLTLIFLLSEIDSMVISPTQYLGNIFSGAFLGVVIALFALFITPKNNSRLLPWIAIGQIYIAYGLAYIAGVSAVTAGLASVLVYVTLGLIKEIWPSNKIKPTPLNTWFGFGLILALFLFLGWQAHQPMSGMLILEVVLGCGIGIMIAWIGQRLNLPSFARKDSPRQVGFRIVLLLFPTLLLWPRGILQLPILLTYALLTAGIVLASSRIVLDYFSKEQE